MKLRSAMLLVALAVLGIRVHAQVETCHVVNAKGVGSLTGPTTTVSQIIGGGLLHGTTTAVLNFTGGEGDVAFYDGTLELTTKHGVVYYDLFNGTFNLATGEFTADSAITGGTGRFDGATGDLYFHGFVLADGVSFFDDEISGSVCLARP